MPIFAKTLNNLSNLPTQEALAAVANHIRVMQEELEHRLMHLDSENIAEIDADVTNIRLKDGQSLSVVLEGIGNEYRSEITLLAESISSKVSSADFESYKVQTAESISSKVSTSTYNTYVEQTAITISSKVSATDYTGENIVSKINQSASKISMSALSIDLSGYVTISSLGKDGSTAIDGSRITTGKISADRIESISVEATSIKGNSIGIKDDEGNAAGTISAYAGRLETYVDYSSEGRLGFTGGSVVISTRDNAASINLDGYYGVEVTGCLYPIGNGDHDLGKSISKWANIWADNDVIQTSDANRKHDIEPLPEKYLWMMDMIEPKRYRMNEGTSGRYHVGFIAQEVEAAMAAAWVDSTEFGGWVRDRDAEGRDIYMLRYDEFIGILWAKIRQLEGRIRMLEV